jgi:hypothetical protein
VDAVTGAAETSSTIIVTRRHVEEYFGHDGYSCYCNAWNSKGVKATSFSATVSVACELNDE